MIQEYDNKDIGDVIDKSYEAGIKEGYRRCKEETLKDAIDAWVSWVADGSHADIVFNHNIAETYNDGQHLKMVLIKD